MVDAIIGVDIGIGVLYVEKIIVVIYFDVFG